ncbi:MAG: alpha/beta fold hydrolase [Oligoflexus sp.]
MSKNTLHRVEFPSEEGHLLAGRLELPDGEIKAYAIFAHCFTCSKNVAAASRISRQLAQKNIAVLRFDFTGLGNSEGDFANSNFSSNIADLLAAADYLRKTAEAPQLLVGHSLGGTAALIAAAKIPEVKALVTIGAPFDPQHVVKNFHADLAQIKELGEAEVTLAGRSFRIKKQFLDDITNYRGSDGPSQLNQALLVMHAIDDQIVEFENAERIFAAAPKPKSFVSLDQADHLLSNKKDSAYIAEIIAAWAERYFRTDAQDSEQRRKKEQLREHEVIVRSLPLYLNQALISKDHDYRADEPESLGGNNLGPSPYQLLLWSLGACTSMTLQLYAKRKDWDLQQVDVQLHHEKIKNEENGQARDVIQRTIRVSGNLDEEQRKRLKEIANRCPIHRTLENQPLIKTDLDKL